jgi:hypothetical protein
MRTDAQINASRANGSLSRGPKTEEGRRKVAFNALRHGLTAKTVVLCNESRERFQEMFDHLVDVLEPADELEFGFVEEAAAARWRLRRIWGVETAIIDHEMDRQAPQIEEIYEKIDESTRTALALARLADESKGPSLVARYETRYLRALHSALKNLRAAQNDRRKAEQREEKAAARAQVVEREKAPPAPNEPAEPPAKPAATPPAPVAATPEPPPGVRKDVSREISSPISDKIPSPPPKK